MRTRRRVLFSSHGAGRYGAERVLLAMVEDAAASFDITVEFPHQGPALDIARAMGGVDVVVSGRSRLPRNAAEFVAFAASFPAACLRVGRVVRSSNWDAVWVNSVYNVSTAIAARRAGCRVVWHVHEANFPDPAGTAAAALVRSLADIVVVPSRFVAESFRAAGVPERMLRVVANGLLRPMAAAPLRPPDGRFVVGYVGQLAPRKRVPDVIDALALIERGAHAVVAGDGKARNSIETRIRRRNMQHAVTLHGYVDDVAAHMAMCDCIAIPSRNEPFGLVALEAMAVGRPVVAAHSGALPEVLGNAALYHRTGDSATIAGHMQQLRSDPGLVAKLIANGNARVSLFTRQGLMDGVASVLREVMADEPVRDAAP
jgi:glycosyltransferase involved in cell wall biosynthesis